MKTSCHKSNRILISPHWRMGLFLGLLLALICNCGGANRQIPPLEAASQVKPRIKHNEVNEKLLHQISQATFDNYKDYQIGPEDVLAIQFLGQDELNREVRVNGRGEISLPLVGSRVVAGSSPQETELFLAKSYREGRFLKEPQITVSVKEFRSQGVAVTGAVVRPGPQAIIGPRSLLEILGKAGGLSEEAGDVVQIIRVKGSHPRSPRANTAAGNQGVDPFSTDNETIIVDLKRLVNDRSLARSLPIKNGDTIYVPPMGRAYVLGAVTKPGAVPLKGNLSVAKAVAISGGLNMVLASNKITIVRLDEQGQPSKLYANLGSITSGQDPDIPLKDSDIVFVHENVVRRFMFDLKNLWPGSMGVSYGLAP